MQSARDSFFMALRQRLSAVNASRVITLDGQRQPAIVLSDVQSAAAAEIPADCFCVSFGAAEVAHGFERAPQPLMALSSSISYYTRGSSPGGSDRGRMLAALDAELLQMCVPPSTPVLDYTQSPASALGTKVFWLSPKLGEVKDEGGVISRIATLTLFFFDGGNA